MARVVFDHVTKRFDGTVAVRELDLEIDDGEFLVLVGPSGCGKTTALRMLAGLEQVTAGRIVIGDRVVNNLAPGDRDVAMVFQSYALYPHMTVYDNLAFGLRNSGVPRSEIDTRVRRAAEILGMDDLLRRKPRQLSGGQRQRVALGRAIVREPAAFLMDEPLSNLDAALRVQTRAEILKLQSGLGTTTVYVTHDQVEAMTMGHRMAVMRSGLLQQVGTPEDVYTRPANAFVGGFVGSPAMNQLLVEVGDGVLRQGAFELRVPPSLTDALRPHGRVIAGLRPEDLERAEGAPGEREARLDARVEVVEFLGDRQLLHVDAAGVALVAELPAEPRAQPGEQLELALPLAKLHVFDAESELALDLLR
jgi:multiple sugar transport system ATP-binding protein